jgi:hypothetical protein
MEKDAAAVLSEPVVEGVILLARGAAKKIRSQTAGIGGLIGGAIIRSASDRLTKDTAAETLAPGGYTGGAFLALTSSRLVLFSTQDGRWKQKLGDALAEFQPGQVDRFEFGKAATGVGTLDLLTTDGDRWAFEYSKVVKKKLVRMAEASRAMVVDL